MQINQRQIVVFGTDLDNLDNQNKDENTEEEDKKNKDKKKNEEKSDEKINEQQQQNDKNDNNEVQFTSSSSSTTYGGYGASPNVESHVDLKSKKLNINSNDDTTSFDELGPLLLNADGTLSRIKNWQELSDAEKQKAAKMVAKKNKQRKEQLGLR